MNEFILQLITFIHILFVLFVIITPFTNSNYLLLIYVIVIPFVMLHWVMNDNTCILTIMEKHARKQLYGEDTKTEDCFTCRLIEPVYDFNKNYSSMSTAIYIITIVLWLIAVYKLYSKYRSGEISSLYDLFTFSS